MFEYIKKDWQNVNEKLKTMHRGDLKKKFTAAVVVSVIAALIEVFFIVMVGGDELTVGSLLVVVPCSIVGGFFAVFGYIIEWRFLFHWMVAPFHGKTKMIPAYLLGIPFIISMICYIPIIYIIGFKALFVMNSRR